MSLYTDSEGPDLTAQMMLSQIKAFVVRIFLEGIFARRG